MGHPAVPDPAVAFGYGRRWVPSANRPVFPRLIAFVQHRLCPDRHMSSASLWITVSSVLATSKITEVVDENGREIEPSYGFDSGFIK